jgi:hypothetical protein
VAERTINPAPAAARSRDWTTLGLGMAAAVLVGIGPILSLLAAVQLNDPSAPERIEAFYADRSRWQLMLIAEPAALLGVFALLAFVGRLRAALGETVTTASLSAGAIVFAALGFASVAVQTTTAGTAMFAPAFEPDPHVAMALSHLGYVLLAGAMMGAATMAFSIARIVGRSPRLPRWLRPLSFGLGLLSIGSFLFVYAPLMLFLIWLPILGTVASRPADEA